MEVLNYLIEFFTNYGYWAVFFVLIACGIGVPIPEDITLIAGGVICALSNDTHHVLLPEIMSVISLIGVLGGDAIMFLMGRKLGSKVTRVKGIRRIITKEIYVHIQEKVHKYGDKILFFARFLPGLRAPIYIMAGVSHKVSYFKFLLMDGLAALISVPSLIYLGYFFANDLDHVLNYVKHSEVLIIGLIVSGVLFTLIYKRSKNKKIK
ncbi:MAG: DedA family protein [Proteobacteria bacterium]|nr:DedA family protein [Pseudomonadota bacterium]